LLLIKVQNFLLWADR